MLRIVSTLLIAIAFTADAQLIQTRQPSWTDQWTFGASFMGGKPVGEFRNGKTADSAGK